MGVMCGQEPRPKREIDINSTRVFSDMIKEIAEKQKISYELALKTYELMAYERRTDIMIDDGNFTDENMCGIGTAIKNVAENFHDVVQVLEEIARREK